MVTNGYDMGAATLNTVTLNPAAVDAYTTKSNYATANYATAQVSSSSILTTADAISEYVQSQLATKNKTETETVKEENNKMDNKIFNFDFGPLKSDNVRMSMALLLRIEMATMQHGIKKMRVS